MPDKEWLQQLRQRCDEKGALLIVDEIQAGFGRTGTLWGFERYGVVPDILLLGKALGGGLPMGAFIADEPVMRALTGDPVLGHITTFGGHPLSCAAGLAALNVIVRERLYERAATVGKELVRRLLEMRATNPEITAVRGLGMLVGIEFRDAALTRRFVAATIARGVIVNWTLNADNVVRLAPPLTIMPDEVDFALTAMKKALDEVRR